jgi:CheY-like chemotaxis protein
MLRGVTVDDSSVFLRAARSLLERQRGSVVGVARTAEEAVRRVEELRPDVIMLDVNLAGESGFELANRLFLKVGF